LHIIPRLDISKNITAKIVVGMQQAFVLVFLLLIVLLGLLYSRSNIDGFIDVKQMQKDFTQRQLGQFGNIPVSLISSKQRGALGESANNMLRTPGVKANYPLSPAKDGLWAIIDKCESVTTMDCTAFDDPAFALNCGVCLDIGKNSQDVAASGGMVLLPEDKESARSARRSDFIPEYVPTLGFCPARKMVSTKEECLKLQRELLCQKNASYDLPGCSQCYADTTYSVVDPKTSPGVIAGYGTISVIGNGTLTIQQEGGDTSSKIVLSETTPYTFEVTATEGSRIKFTVLPPPNSTKIIPYIGGYIGGNTFSGEWTQDLRRIILIDEISGRKPRTHGMTTVNGNIVTKMASGFGFTSILLTAMIPFTFVDSMREEAAMCKNSPFVTTQAAAEFLQSDPCYKKGSAPGNYNLECLQGIWVSNGCNQSGKGYPNNAGNASQLMTNNDGSYRKINDISDYIYNMAVITSTGIDENGVKQKQKDWSDASVFCTGRMVTSPCDTPTKDSGPLSPECIVFLWNNEGSKKIWTGQTDPIGPTYYTSDSISLFKQGSTSRACQAGGTLSPINIDGTQKKDMINYWQGMGGIDNVKQLMANLHRAANAQAVADDQLAPYFKQCYGDISFASRPPTIPESQRPPPTPSTPSAPPPVNLPPPPANPTGYVMFGDDIVDKIPVNKILSSPNHNGIKGLKIYLAQDGQYIKTLGNSQDEPRPVSFKFPGSTSNITDLMSYTNRITNKDVERKLYNVKSTSNSKGIYQSSTGYSIIS
jgi:hypothetical protein